MKSSVITSETSPAHFIENYRFKVLGVGERAADSAPVLIEENNLSEELSEQNFGQKGENFIPQASHQTQTNSQNHFASQAQSPQIQQTGEASFVEELLKKTDELSSNIIKLQMQIENQESEFAKRLEAEISRAKEDGKNEGIAQANAANEAKINELEARLISEILDDIGVKLRDAGKRDELKRIYAAEKKNLSNVYELAREYKISFRLSEDLAIARISFLLNLAYIDGDFARSEREVIEKISDAFGLSRPHLERVIAGFEKFYGSYKSKPASGNKNPYEILGLSEQASFEEVKKRYRELVKKYHPDILMGRGESEEMIEKSTRKLQEINEAYETIKNNTNN